MRHKGKRLRLFFQDEARIGQKGRVCHIWWKRGERPPGLCDKRFADYEAIADAACNAWNRLLTQSRADKVAMLLPVDLAGQCLGAAV